MNELEPCPHCTGNNIQVEGDDFDGDVFCNDCKLCTYVCYGTRNAIRVWNGRIRIKEWSFLTDDNRPPDVLHYSI
jgi:hypothetical protein